jgi:AcrR family transcriptional regulator
LELVADGEMRPTAQEVADRAGVALRTVYHHFEDVEALRHKAYHLQFERHNELLTAVDENEALDVRIVELARRLRRLYEAITPIRRATASDEHASEEMAEGLRRTRGQLRGHLEGVFSKELRAHSEPKVLLDACEVLCSWSSWDFLRSGLSRSAISAERTVVFSLRELISPVEARKRRSGG